MEKRSVSYLEYKWLAETHFQSLMNEGNMFEVSLYLVLIECVQSNLS